MPAVARSQWCVTKSSCRVPHKAAAECLTKIPMTLCTHTVKNVSTFTALNTNLCMWSNCIVKKSFYSNRTVQKNLCNNTALYKKIFVIILHCTQIFVIKPHCTKIFVLIPHCTQEKSGSTQARGKKNRLKCKVWIALCRSARINVSIYNYVYTVCTVCTLYST